MLAGIFLFAGTHFISALRPVRAQMIGVIGEGPYKGIYSLLSIAGVVIMVLAREKVRFILLYNPPEFAKLLAHLMMLPAFMLLLASRLPSNIKRYTRHPMLWGFTLWATAHLLNNGDLAAFMFFGTFAGYSVFGMIIQTTRGAKKSEVSVPRSKDILILILSVVLYLGFAIGHRWLFGIRVF